MPDGPRLCVGKVLARPLARVKVAGKYRFVRQDAWLVRRYVRLTPVS